MRGPGEPFRLPRLVVAAPSTGQGKTTVAAGLMAALTASGQVVSGHKVGPDYIDPGYHALACGRPGRNLDPHLTGEHRVTPLLLHGARGADLAVIEGVMGLHDGRLGTDGFASTAHVARLTRTPVILVVDLARASRSVAAVAAGMADFDSEVDVAGVILNRTGSARNVTEVERALRLPVFGALPRDDDLATPSRHLGLVPATERSESAAAVARLGEQVARHLDLRAISEVARSAPDLDGPVWDPAVEVAGPSPTVGEPPLVAMAGGRAFTFRYAETEELLRASGCRVVDFDPLTDIRLPAGTQGLYLGGGFPEMYAAELAANRTLLADLRDAIAAGIPTVAECAGLLYLSRRLDGASMAGALPAEATMTPRLTLRLVEATAAADSLLTRRGEVVAGHEFHRTELVPAAGLDPAWRIDDDTMGFATPTLHASYLHVHWAGHPQLAQRFADAVHAATPYSASLRRAPTPPTAPQVSEPLRHHGDREVGPGLVDFAVNVYAGERPAWLDRALQRGLEEAAAYPDPEPARAAIAHRHGRREDEVLPTAGAAEAFDLIARLKPWRHAVVIHPQFTEPHAALARAGHPVTTVVCDPAGGFALDPDQVPDDADLVVLGNPTNPTGVLHPAEVIARLRRPKRIVVVDEAFMDAVPGEQQSLVRNRRRGLLVVRSLTKHWSMPGIRAGYVLGSARTIHALSRRQVPWSVSAPAVQAMVACATHQAVTESRARAENLAGWRSVLERGLADRHLEFVPSAGPFVLARIPAGGWAALREHGIAVRRADTFPGLDGDWVRIAVRPPGTTRRLLAALDLIGYRPAVRSTR
ncbi:MAG: cobyrinate a,c-diamide synthase [Nocardioides sp.]|uniref:cobyrinate a,c-diamide synthase n=1 Tax=Nocardioides sp. TaxID=35761 RepID=UPI0039E72160